MARIVRNTPYQETEDSEEVTDPGRIAKLLAQMSKHYTPLIIKIPGDNERYTSCIVDVEKPYVLLDELMPETGHKNLLAARKISVRGKFDGIDIKFTAKLVRVNSKKVVTYYFNLPKKLSYQQRRSAYRVRIPQTKLLHVLIDNGHDNPVVGELRDLSHGGVGKIIGTHDSVFKMGEVYESVIELPCGEWMFCSVEMRYKKNINSKSKNQFIGAKFVGLSVMQKRLISRCISSLELEAIRKKAMY